MKEFKGIKHSPKTNIYYKFVEGQLYKRCAYRKSNTWEVSGYTDMEKMSRFWVSVETVPTII